MKAWQIKISEYRERRGGSVECRDVVVHASTAADALVICGVRHNAPGVDIHNGISLRLVDIREMRPDDAKSVETSPFIEERP